MGTSQMTLAGLTAILGFVAISSLASTAQEAGPAVSGDQAAPASIALIEPGDPSIVDYDGFAGLVAEVEPYRQKRLVSMEEFNRLAADPNTVILDTRSPEAFAAGHIRGAINVNFSDFTDEKLAAVIPSPTTRILIYCNNNFIDDEPPVPLKRAPLALNVPTFVNLYGYGYRNIYELADLVSLDDPAVDWVEGDTLG